MVVAGGRRLHELLAPERCTLLVTQGTDPATALPAGADQFTTWADLIQVIPIGPAGEQADRDQFVATFGRHPAHALIRPDSYVGYLGELAAIPKLVAYLQHWFPHPGGTKPAQ